MADDSKKGGSALGYAPLVTVASLLAIASPPAAATAATTSAEDTPLTIEQRVERVRNLVAVDPTEYTSPITEPGGPPARVLQWPNWPNYWNNWPNWRNWNNWNNWVNWYN